MPRLLIALSAVVMTAAVAGGAVAGVNAAAAPAAAASTPTVSVVIRPVTSTGEPEAGFKVTNLHGKIDCSYPTPSPGAVDPNIEYCAPDAAAAFACWKSETPGHALCLQDPGTQKLAKFGLAGKFAKTAAPKAKDLEPLRLVLGDGNQCSLLTDGTGGHRTHPSLYTTYFCSKNSTAVWAKRTAIHGGVNETNATWTVRVGKGNGTGSLRTEPVAEADFVGTGS